MEWLIYVAAVLYIAPITLGMPMEWSYNCGIVALFFAWFNFLLFLQR